MEDIKRDWLGFSECEEYLEGPCTESSVIELVEFMQLVNKVNAGDPKYQEHTKLSDRAIERLNHIYNSKLNTDQNQYHKYIANIDNIINRINTYGVAIVPNIIDQDEIIRMRSGMWDTLEYLTCKMEIPIKRNDPSTYRTFFELKPLHGMLIQYWAIGHAQYVWDLRQNPKIVNIFNQIYGVSSENLTVSFDGVAINLPHEITNRGFYRNDTWLHTDQSLLRNGFECIQSWVTGFDVNPGDATLTFLEGSNKHHQALREASGRGDNCDWYQLTPNEIEWYENMGCKKRNIICKAGDLVLWDSRTIHAGKQPLRERIKQNIRCVVYLCYTPKSLLTQALKNKKLKAFNEKRLTTHWPHKVKLFGKHPRLYKGETLPNVAELPYPQLTDLGKSLTGAL